MRPCYGDERKGWGFWRTRGLQLNSPEIKTPSKMLETMMIKPARPPAQCQVFKKAKVLEGVWEIPASTFPLAIHFPSFKHLWSALSHVNLNLKPALHWVLQGRLFKVWENLPDPPKLAHLTLNSFPKLTSSLNCSIKVLMSAGLQWISKYFFPTKKNAFSREKIPRPVNTTPLE